MFVRYTTEDANGETREQRNERFGQADATTEWDIPDDGLYLWDWYWEISDRLKRVSEGVALPIAWSEFISWQNATRHIVMPFEFDILSAMDDAFVAGTNEELAAARAALEAQAKADAAKSKGGPKRKG